MPLREAAEFLRSEGFVTDTGVLKLADTNVVPQGPRILYTCNYTYNGQHIRVGSFKTSER